MSLSELYAAHLRSPDRLRRDLAGVLDGAGLEREARAYEAWCTGNAEVAADGAWWGRRIAVASTPPTGTAGDLWFDVCELALMVHAGRAWVSTRPTARWQVSGFLAVSARVPRPVQVAPPYRALDPARLVPGDELAPCTQLTAGEATLYSWWYGKLLPHLFDWQSAQESLPGSLMRELWQASKREWTSTKLDEDEAARIFVTPSTIDWDPDDILDNELALPEARRGMIRGELTRERDIGFRTAVLLQTGLLETVSAWNFIAEDVRLESLLDRRLFR